MANRDVSIRISNVLTGLLKIFKRNIKHSDGVDKNIAAKKRTALVADQYLAAMRNNVAVLNKRIDGVGNAKNISVESGDSSIGSSDISLHKTTANKP